MLPEKESVPTELVHVMVGVGFPTAEQFTVMGLPSVTVYVAVLGDTINDCGSTVREIKCFIWDGYLLTSILY